MSDLVFPRQKFAAIITEILAPAPLAMLAVAIVDWQTARTPLQALVWTIIGVVFAPLVPFLHLVRQVQRGVVTDHHVQLREQRPRILLIALASGLSGLVLLAVLGAPPGLVALLAAGATSLAVALLITLRWKISVHVGAVAGIITVCAILLGPCALVLVPLVPLVAWARVEMGAHTPAQTIAGGLIGALVSGVAFIGILTLVSP
jgi:membrane-associated phospholipid phosphatase